MKTTLQKIQQHGRNANRYAALSILAAIFGVGCAILQWQVASLWCFGAHIILIALFFRESVNWSKAHMLQ